MKKRRNDFEDKSEFKQANYIILSGNDSISGNSVVKDTELKVLKSEGNKNGELIKVVIGSSVTGEGIDFKNIREIHVLDPWYHLNKLEQIIGRGIRFCSHSMLEKEKRNVTVFLHTSTYNGMETTDHYNYRRGEKKSIEIGGIEMILKRNALDCYLFKDGNIIKEKDVTPVKIISSKGVSESLTVYDKPNTKICSFQDKCSYNCINVNSKELNNLKEKELNYDTFDSKHFVDITKKIVNYINELFSKKNYYSLKEILEHIQYHKDINKYIIYNSIKDILDHKEIIYDINKNKGYVINRGDYYIFQPLFNNDESVPMFYRSTLVNKQNSVNINNIKINYPEEIEYESDESDSNIENITDKLKEDYNNFISDKKKKLSVFNLIKTDIKYKTIYCHYLLDKLTYEIRNIFIRYLLENDFKDIKLKEGKLTEEEILKISYDYFSNQFIYSKDHKYELFSSGKPLGYFILNEHNVKKQTKKIKKKIDIARELGKCIEYYIKSSSGYITSDIIKGNLNINTGKYWVHSYWNKKAIIKLIIEPNLGKEGNSGNVSKTELIDYLKINIEEDIFNKLRKDIILLSEYTKDELCELIDIIFRIKTMLNKDISYYVKFDLLYHKLK